MAVGEGKAVSEMSVEVGAVQSCRSITASSINCFLEMCQIPFHASHMS